MNCHYFLLFHCDTQDFTALKVIELFLSIKKRNQENKVKILESLITSARIMLMLDNCLVIKVPHYFVIEVNKQKENEVRPKGKYYTHVLRSDQYYVKY